jgi:RES domain
VSAVSADALAAVPAGPRVVRVYLRHCFIPAAGDPDPLWVNPALPSRWWTPRGTLYVAEDPDTVMAEHCRNSPTGVQDADPTGGVGLNANNFGFYAAAPVGDPLPARALYMVDAAFARLADLRSPLAAEALRGLGISADDLLADDYGPCPALAQAGEQLGWQAIRARSAANPDGTALAIFRAAFPLPAAWRMQLAAARPSVRTAYLTRYRAGERPGWLAAA